METLRSPGIWPAALAAAAVIDSSAGLTNSPAAFLAQCIRQFVLLWHRSTRHNRLCWATALLDQSRLRYPWRLTNRAQFTEVSAPTLSTPGSPSRGNQ
jgi:hypothetical protein